MRAQQVWFSGGAAQCVPCCELRNSRQCGLDRVLPWSVCLQAWHAVPWLQLQIGWIHCVWRNPEQAWPLPAHHITALMCCPCAMVCNGRRRSWLYSNWQLRCPLGSAAAMTAATVLQQLSGWAQLQRWEGAKSAEFFGEAAMAPSQELPTLWNGQFCACQSSSNSSGNAIQPGNTPADGEAVVLHSVSADASSTQHGCQIRQQLINVARGSLIREAHQECRACAQHS